MKKYLLILLFGLYTAQIAQAESVGSARAPRIVNKSASARAAFLGTGSGAYLLNVPHVQIDLTNKTPGIFKTGTVYQLPSPIKSSQLFWEAVDGGYAARIRLVSDQAKRLRYHLVFNKEIPGMVFKLQGSQDKSRIITVDQSYIQDKDIWLPITNGNSADLEIFVQGSRPPIDSLFVLDAVNVIVADMRTGTQRKVISKEKPSLSEMLHYYKPQTVGFIKEVEYDLACWTEAAEYPALAVAADATALISFIKEGASFVCTGTLLNDKNQSFKPWFITANHCITNQKAANTIAFEWFYRATGCLTPETDSRYTTTFGGARMLASDRAHDLAFLRLRARPPDGAVYAGWDTNRLFIGKEVWGVHHPEGDHTMVSQGRVSDVNIKVQGPDEKDRNVNEVIFSVGGAEIGSSGSGIFITKGGAPYWVGGLYGGPANDYQLNYYTSLRNFYGKIRPWLGKRKRAR